MSYSVKKAGVGFKIKVETNADFTGQAGGFSSYYIDDATGTKTAIVGSFTEDANTAGLYFSPTITIPAAGDYTLVVNNGAAGMDNHPTPLVVTNATIDDVKVVVDDLTTTLNTVAADVDGLNGQDLSDIKQTLTDVQAMINDRSDVGISFTGDITSWASVGDVVKGSTSNVTGTVDSITYDSDSDTTTVVVAGPDGLFVAGETVLNVDNSNTSSVATINSVNANMINTVLDFVRELDASLSSGGTSLAALAGYTDDIENMLLGTEFLADGVTPNVFYDAANPGVAKESTLNNVLTTLQSDMGVFRTSVETKVNNVQTAVDAVKVVVDSNATLLADPSYGLANLKTLIDGLSTDISADSTAIVGYLTDATSGLAAIRTAMDLRFDSVDSALTAIDGKIDGLAGARSFGAFV